MNSRQAVLIAMFLSVAVYLLANAQASTITTNIGKIKQVPGTTLPPATVGGVVDNRIVGGQRNA